VDNQAVVVFATVVGGDDALSGRVDERVPPGVQVGAISIWVGMFLVGEVRVQRGYAMFSAPVVSTRNGGRQVPAAPTYVLKASWVEKIKRWRSDMMI
jgi:hypothetical protein